MKALIDADILRYEVGFGAEQAWCAMTNDKLALPTWDFVERFLLERIDKIVYEAKATDYELFLTRGRTFRYEVAVSRPYKGQRPDCKPYHFHNLTAYITNCLPCTVSEWIEADDRMAISHCNSNHPIGTVLCSRDKDLRQVPGWFYSWELGRQGSFGPYFIEEPGWLKYEPTSKLGRAWNWKLEGVGYKWFCAQMLMGDRTDNIPGLPGYGPSRAYEILKDCNNDKLDLMETVRQEYYKNGFYEDYLVEQSQLLWILRNENEIPPKPS